MQLPASHAMPRLHESSSRHRTAQLPVALHFTSFCAHARRPSQRTAHVPASHATLALHELSPLHCTEHSPLDAQVTGFDAHARRPLQSTRHALAREQSTAWLQESEPVHQTAHGMPGGHTTG